MVKAKENALKKIETFDVFTWFLLALATMIIIIPLYYVVVLSFMSMAKSFQLIESAKLALPGNIS